MTEWISLPGLIDYTEAVALMEKRVQGIIDGSHSEAVFLVENNEIYTAGTSHRKDELLGKNNIPIIYTGRGGKFTYHGPGQRIIYPVLNLGSKNAHRNRIPDIKLYVSNLEQWIINTLAHLHLECYTIKDMVGIWTMHNNTHAKIAAIGIRVKKWITYHGIAVNISTNIENYSGIIPCGINNFPVTSLKELGIEISMKDFDFILQSEFNKIF